MTAVGIVPARFASARYPGKPLVPINGVPMVVRVFRAARQAKHLREVLVATDDERIRRVCAEHEIPVAMTGTHPTGTVRVAEVAASLQDEIVVNIQGDEPLIDPSAIDAVLAVLEADSSLGMATAVHPLDADADDDPNRVKVWVSREGRALGFYRHWPAERESETPEQHIGLYAYRRGFLKQFVGLAQTPGERAAGLEQLRTLEHGHAIGVARVSGGSGPSVDVPADVARVEAALAARGEAAR